MNWVNKKAFSISNRNGKHYIFHRGNNGNIEINIPRNITRKPQAVEWLRANPHKINKPNRNRRKKRYGLLPLANLGAPRKASPRKKTPPKGRVLAARKFNTKERGKLARYLANLPHSSSPKYGQESPTFKRLLKAALKSEGQKVSPNVGGSKFSCSTRHDLEGVIGKGRQGIVYRGDGFAAKVCPKDLKASARKEPQPAVVEFTNQKAAYEAAPKGVAAVYELIHCENFIRPSNINMTNVQNTRNYDKSKQSIIFMEYCDGGSLPSWLSKQRNLNDETLQEVVKVVIKTLYKIHQKYPDFRHNDLHLDNIFMSKRGPLLGDFGWSRLRRSGTNPAVNTANGTTTASFWGVGPSTDSRYDAHLFLNELRSWIIRHDAMKFPATRAFLDTILPEGYRGATDTHVENRRLKYLDPCPGLPSLTKMYRSAYVSGRKMVSSPMLVAARARLRKTARAPSPRVPSPRVPSPKARNKNLLKLSAANFIKLSPTTRARITALRKATKVSPKKPAPKAAGPRVNTTKRTQTRVNLKIAKIRALPKNVFNAAKFDKLVTTIWRSQSVRKLPNGKNESFSNAWNRARAKAINRVYNRINKNLPAFSPSPARAVTPPRARVSPSSGRPKIRSNKSGRWVYADLHYSLKNLRNLATRKGINTAGLRSKEEIARKIFS